METLHPLILFKCDPTNRKVQIGKSFKPLFQRTNLFINGQEKSSKSLTIGCESTGSVTLMWTTQAGDHDHRIEVWEGGKLEASKGGGITVSGALSDLFNVVLTVYTRELEGGGEMYFQMKTSRYQNLTSS